MTIPHQAGPTRMQTPDLVKLRAYLISAVTRELEFAQAPAAERSKAIREALDKTYEQTKLKLPESLRAQLFRDVVDDLMGYGPIQPLLDDPDISEIMVNGPKKIYIERKGKVIKTNVAFENDDHVMRIIERILLPLGRRIDPDSPTVDARLPDGSRVNAVIPPVAIDGPSITIRKFGRDRLTIEQLVELKTLTRQMTDFLRACVIARLNLARSSPPASGRSSLPGWRWPVSGLALRSSAPAWPMSYPPTAAEGRKRLID